SKMGGNCGEQRDVANPYSGAIGLAFLCLLRAALRTWLRRVEALPAGALPLLRTLRVVVVPTTPTAVNSYPTLRSAKAATRGMGHPQASGLRTIYFRSAPLSTRHAHRWAKLPVTLTPSVATLKGSTWPPLSFTALITRLWASGSAKRMKQPPPPAP